MNRVILTMLVVTTAALAHPTTKFPAEIPDPFSDGVCTGYDAGSWGSYVYRWPSKYDQIFWPHTDPDFIWYCEDSGFIAFIGDLKPADSEKEAIRKLLSGRNHPPLSEISLGQKLAMLEEVYAVRGLESRDRIWRLRIFAYLAEQQMQDPELATQYRREALTAIEAALDGELKQQQRLEYLFLAARYNLAFGSKTDAEIFVQELTTAAAVADEETRPFAAYLLETLDEYRHKLDQSAEKSD